MMATNKWSPERKLHLMKSAAALALTGMNVTNMAKDMGVSKDSLRRLCETEEYKKICEGLSNQEIGPVITHARVELSKLVSEAMRVLKYHLKENSLEGVKIVFKNLGLEGLEPERPETAIQIIMPGSEPTPIDAEWERQGTTEGEL